MSGLVKAKEYDWKDSNLALFGSQTEKDVKKAAAETEPAWKSAGKKPGLQIWRINKFKVENWPTDEYGAFYSGDSYIILNTYKDEDSDKLLFDVHFWIGKESTQDEYGTAAYKTVELDTLLDDVPVQHREVQNHESELFKSYFKEMSYMKGGADSGFRRVKPEAFKPRLLHISGPNRNQVKAAEVYVKRRLIKPEDVFILVTKDKIYQFNGSKSSKDERYMGGKMMQNLRSTIPKAEPVVVDEGEDADTDAEFFAAVDAADDQVDDGGDDEKATSNNNNRAVRENPTLVRLTDSSGSLDYKVVKEGGVALKDFNPKDVWFLETSSELFVWVGSRTSEQEKANGIPYAHEYLRKKYGETSPTAQFKAVTCFKQGQEKNSKAFRAAIAA